MFHTFDGLQPTEQIDSVQPQAQARRVNRSCFECTRRKIRCDGEQPCGHCTYYNLAESCGYRQRSRRNAASRRSVTQLDQSLVAEVL